MVLIAEHLQLITDGCVYRYPVQISPSLQLYIDIHSVIHDVISHLKTVSHHETTGIATPCPGTYHFRIFHSAKWLGAPVLGFIGEKNVSGRNVLRRSTGFSYDHAGHQCKVGVVTM